MRIAYVCLEPQQSRAHLSGYAVHLREMSGAFERAGHEVEMFVLGEHLGAPLTASAAAGPGLRRLARRWVPSLVWETIKDLRFVLQQRRAQPILARWIQAARADVLYEQVAFMSRGTGPLASRLGLPRVAEVHAPMAQERARDGRTSLLTAFASRRELASIRTADAVRTVSSAMGQWLVQRGVHPDRVMVLPNGVDLERFSPSRGRRDEVRRRFGLEGRFVFGFVGSFFRWHRLDALIEGFARVARALPDAALLIVGDGEDAVRLRAQAAESSPAGRVAFAGNVPHEEIVDFLAAMDAGCMAGSNWYQSPMKLLEYGAMELPVLGPDTGPVRDFMAPGLDGILVPNGDAGAVAEAMIALRRDEVQRRAMAAHFHSRVLASCSWDAVARPILDRMEAACRTDS